MTRFAFQTVAALGIVIASAVLDFGPRANAAFQTTIGNMESAGSSETPNPLRDSKEVQKRPMPSAHLQGGGGMSSPSSGPYSGSASVVALLPRVEPPVDGLVVYFREPDAAFRLSAFIDSLLDPPRLA